MTSFAVLFVCLGNICRSPMAEALFTQTVKERKLPITVDSAAIGTWHIDAPPDPRTIAEAAKHGIDIRHYRGRQVTAQDFDRFTHIIGMDHKNIVNLQAMASEKNRHKISLLMDYVPDHQGEDVIDPYFHDAAMFSRTWQQVSLGITHLTRQLEQEL